VIEATDLKRN